MDETPKDESSIAASEAGLRGVFVVAFAHWKLWLPAVGGLSLLLHFWRIGYAPTLSFSDLGTVLGAMLLFGVVALFSIVLVLVLPSALIAFWVSQNLLTPPPKQAAKEGALERKGLRSYVRSHPELGWSVSDKSPPSRFETGSLSWFLAAAFWTCGLSFAIVYGGAQLQIPQTSRVFTTFFAIGLVSAASTLFLLDMRFVRRRIPKLRHPNAQFLLISSMYIAFWPILLVVFDMMKTNMSGLRGFILTMSLAFAPLLHYMWHATHRHTRITTEKKIAKLLPIPMFFAYTVMPLSIIDRALDTFGLGMMPNVDVVLTARGCEIVHAAWPERVCTPDHRGAAEAYRLENIEVLTRIGGHYFVAAPGALDDKALPRFPIPADEVLSWRRRPPVKPADEKAK